jgi:cytochrome c553
MRRFTLLAISILLAGFVACSDDDGSNVVPNGPPGAGTGGGGAGGAPDGGPAGAGGSGAGRGGTGGGGAGGAGGSAGCTPTSTPDAGSDAGALDAGSTDAGLDASAEGPPSGVVSFEQDVHPIFVASCGPCHVANGEGSHNVGGPDLAMAYDQAVGIGQRLVTRVDGGGMPPSYADPPNNCGDQGGDQPGDPGCLTVAEVELIQAWINQCYPR